MFYPPIRVEPFIFSFVEYFDTLIILLINICEQKCLFPVTGTLNGYLKVSPIIFVHPENDMGETSIKVGLGQSQEKHGIFV